MKVLMVVAILLLIPVSSNLMAQDSTLSLAILPLRAIVAEPEEAGAIATALRNEFEKRGGYSLLESSAIAALLMNEDIDLNQCKNDSCLGSIGRLLNVRRIAAGHIEWAGSVALVHVLIIDTARNKTVREAWIEGRSIQELCSTGISELVDLLERPEAMSPDVSPVYGVILVETSEDSTEIYLDNRPVGLSPVPGYMVKGGVHVVGISKTGFFRESNIVEVTPGDTVQITFMLKPRPKTGILRIAVVPEDAQIMLDGQLMQPATLNSVELKPGSYRLTAQKQGYLDLIRSIQIAAGDTLNADLNLRLIPKGFLSISASEDSSEIFIDNRRLGYGPIPNLEIAAGVHVVGVRKIGFISQSQTIELAPRDTIQISFTLEPRPTTGTLVLDISEDDAEIYLDGEFVGISPHERVVVAPGIHRIDVHKTDYTSVSVDIEISPGHTSMARINMEKAPFGVIEVKIALHGSEVYLDNKLMGFSPLPGFRVRAGVHMIGVRRLGYLGESKRIEVSPGDTIDAVFRLKPRVHDDERVLVDEIIVK